MLIDWKKLPSYQLEPRIDSIVGYYLPEILEDFLKEKINGIIPELPLKCRESKRSYKVDFYAQGETGKNYFIEMKSDSNSRRDKQDVYLQRSIDIGMSSIVSEILSILNVSRYKKKYAHLKSKLIKLNLVDDSDQFIGTNCEIKIIYIQPRILKGEEGDNTIGFSYIAKWLKEHYSMNEFAIELSNALMQWVDD